MYVYIYVYVYVDWLIFKINYYKPETRERGVGYVTNTLKKLGIELYTILPTENF